MQPSPPPRQPGQPSATSSRRPSHGSLQLQARTSASLGSDSGQAVHAEGEVLAKPGSERPPSETPASGAPASAGGTASDGASPKPAEQSPAPAAAPSPPPGKKK